MIKFESMINITPPPYSDYEGRVIYPKPIEFNELKFVFVDNPISRTILAQAVPTELYITLWKNDEYDMVGDWTKAQAEAKISDILGNDPATYLRSLYPKTLEEYPNHPGTILSKMIKSIGFQISDSCSCKQHALEMNEKGNDWCESNTDLIVSWLREESKKRKLPFIDAIGKLIVGRAIKKSRKLLANEPVPENDEDLDTL